MHMKTAMVQIFFLIALLLALDMYVFQSVKVVSKGWLAVYQGIVYSIFWIISALTLTAILFLPNIRNHSGVSTVWKVYPLAMLIGFFIAKLIAVTFFLTDDLRRLFLWVVNSFSGASKDLAVQSGHADAAISRSVFLSWMGFAFGGTVFTTLVYGFKNQYNYQVKNIKLSFDNLPAGFKGLRVVQISDIHSGSFMKIGEVEKGIEKIMSLNADIIFFTGDLVNDRASEMEPFLSLFSRLQAPLGVYSVLGNHDYGDYVSWPNAIQKKENLEKLKSFHAQMGWRLLMDEFIEIQKGGDTIAVIGVQNTSGKNSFHSYGNLKKAYGNAHAIPFKILLSHDPSHWDHEVKIHYPSIDLTLSGHTHGMQFGVEIPGFKWSPVQWMYKQWAGLYESGSQKLYVNRGFGFIGYPGRVGILPEITLFELV